VQKSFYLKTFVVFVGCILHLNIYAAPLTIEIDHGIEPLPHQTGDVDHTISSSFAQIIDAEDIPDSHIDLSQVIENNSGIKIRRIGALGSYTQASIRGKSADQLMIYVDGMLMNSAAGGGIDLSLIPVNQIARIEIYKDVIPIEFSEVANGGVINIITHRTKPQKSSQIQTSMGSFNTYNLNANHFNHYKKWQYAISGGYVNAKNNFPFIYEYNTPKNLVGDSIELKKHNQFSQINFDLKTKYELTPTSYLNVHGGILDKSIEIPSFSIFSDSKASYTYESNSIDMNYINQNPFYKNLELNLSFKAGEINTVYDDRFRNIGLEPIIIKQHTRSLSQKLYLKYKSNRYQLVLSQNIQHEKLSNTSTRFNGTENTSQDDKKINRRLSLSTAIEGHIFSKNKKMIVSPGGRFLITNNKFHGNTLSETANENNLKKSYYTFSPQIGMRYQLWSDTSIKLNIGKYYRQPNYIELFGTQGYIGSNESLKPENGINFDTGFEHFAYLQSEFLTTFNWNFTLFHSIINNEIVYAFDSRGIGAPENNSKSIITGIENNFIFEFNYSTELILNTTLQLPLNKSNPNKPKMLAGRSVLSNSTRISKTYESINYFAEHDWESFYYYDSEERLPSKKRSIFNTGISLNSHKLRFNLTLNNVFDHRNKDYVSQVSPGRSIIFTTTFRIT